MREKGVVKKLGVILLLIVTCFTYSTSILAYNEIESDGTDSNIISLVCEEERSVENGRKPGAVGCCSSSTTLVCEIEINVQTRTIE